MTSYAKVVPETNNQKLQNFISDSPWDEKPVIEQIQLDVTNLIGDKTNGSIHIDESGFKKDGKDSVGVKRQYLGRLGKIGQMIQYCVRNVVSRMILFSKQKPNWVWNCY